MVGQETEKEEAGGVSKGQVKGQVVRKREKSAGLVHCLAAKTLLICNPNSLSSTLRQREYMPTARGLVPEHIYDCTFEPWE